MHMQREPDAMATGTDRPTWTDLADALANSAAGGAIFTVALFPLALPLLILTVAALVGLLLVVLVAGLVAAVIAAPVVLARRLLRRPRAAPARRWRFA
jgi:hypothetical protein